MYGAAAHIKHDIIPIVLVLVYHFLSHSYFSYSRIANPIPRFYISLRKGTSQDIPFLGEVYVQHLLYL